MALAHFDEVPGSVPYFGVDVQVGKGVVVSLDHLAFPADEIRAVLPASGQREVRPPFKVTAGQRIGRVQPARPNAAYAMDLVTTDERNENPFVNRERFRSNELRAFLVGVCFERFLDPARVPAIAALYGEGGPVPGTTCGNASRDVPSALAGMWFLDAPGEGEDGERFAIARR